MIFATLFMLLGWFILFMVTELKCAQSGRDTWQWVQRLYDRSPVLQRIKW